MRREIKRDRGDGAYQASEIWGQKFGVRVKTILDADQGDAVLGPL